MTNITVVGTGYVGLATGATLAELGHDVTCLDVDQDKIGQLRRGHLPVYEPGHDRLVADNVAANQLHFTSDYAESVPVADFISIAVGTPPGVNGWGADLTQVCSAARSIGEHLDHPVIIVNTNTVPIGTRDRLGDQSPGEFGKRDRRRGTHCVVRCPKDVLPFGGGEGRARSVASLSASPS